MADDRRGNEIANLILRLWWVVALSMAVGIGISLVALLVIQPTYTATATQLVKGIPGSGAGANYMAAQFAESRARSYPTFIGSKSVLDAVRADLGSTFTDAELMERLAASNPEDTPLVKVTATGRSAKEAQDLANTASRRLASFITDIEKVAGRSPVEVEIAVEAGLPRYASFPNKTLFVAMGTSVGLALGVVLVLVLRSLALGQRTRPVRGAV